MHDLALALERAVVSWLDLPETGTATADLAATAVLLDGYQTVRRLTGAEAVALPLLLPVVHVEYALSEADYFTGVAVSPEMGTANADLAYEYLIGHARWFGQPPGAALLRFLSDYCARLPALVGRAVGRAVRVVAVLLLAQPDQPGRGREVGVVDLEGGVGDAVLPAQVVLQVGADCDHDFEGLGCLDPGEIHHLEDKQAALAEGCERLVEPADAHPDQFTHRSIHDEDEGKHADHQQAQSPIQCEEHHNEHRRSHDGRQQLRQRITHDVYPFRIQDDGAVQPAAIGIAVVRSGASVTPLQQRLAHPLDRLLRHRQ